MCVQLYGKRGKKHTHRPTRKDTNTRATQRSPALRLAVLGRERTLPADYRQSSEVVIALPLFPCSFQWKHRPQRGFGLHRQTSINSDTFKYINKHLHPVPLGGPPTGAFKTPNLPSAIEGWMPFFRSNKEKTVFPP